MTDKKPIKRQVALPRLHKSIVLFMDAHDIGDDAVCGVLLAEIQAEWFKDAQK